MRTDQLEFVGVCRSMGMVWSEIAAGVRDRFGVNGFVGMRLAHGWSQRDAAEQWTRRWPQDPKTFKNFSYWENWTGPAGYAPSLSVLTRLAELFECAVPDLVCDLGDFRDRDILHPDAARAVSPVAVQRCLWEAMSGVLDRLADASVDEVSAAGLLWAHHLSPGDPAYGLLMKLSAGLALAAAAHAGTEPSRLPSAPRQDGRDLAGLWQSRQCGARGRREYTMVLTAHRGRLHGKSLPHPGGGQLRLYLEADADQVSGTWEETTPGRITSGTLRLQAETGRRRLAGQWIGFDTGFHTVGGEWEMTWRENTATGSILHTHRTPT